MSSTNFHQGRMLSRPMDLFWAGWRTDTLALQQYGWELSMQQDYMRNVLQLAIKHPQLGVVGMSRGCDYRELAHRDSLHASPIKQEMQLSHRLQVRVMNTDFNPSAFSPVDATPVYTEEEIHNIEDLQIFKTVNQDTQKVYLSKASMGEVLEVALSKQEDKQAEIRQRMLRDERLKDMRRNSDIKAELRLVV